jgi:predicted RND superfamily exporter protein
MTKIIIKLRWWIIGACILIGVSFAALIPFSRTDPEIRNYIPASLDSRMRTDRIEKEFGTQDMVVILFTDSCILNTPDLLQIRKVDRDLSKISGISERISPFTIKTIKGEEGMMTAEPLVGSVPNNSSDIANLKQKVKDNPLAGNIVFSSDFTTASITATIKSLKSERVTLGKIDSVISISPGPASVKTGGLPYIRKYIMKDVQHDAIIIVPMALLIMLIILKLTLGDWRSVFMPFTVVLLSTAVSIGLIPLLGWKISILTLIEPIILVAVANNYGIYLVARHQEIGTTWNGSRDDMIGRLTKSLNMPILFSGLTTIAGILGLLTHTIIPAKQVGVLASIGVTMALIMSLLLIPALLFIKGPGSKTIRNDRFNTLLFNKLLGWLSRFILRSPGSILAYSLLFTVLISLGMVFLKIDTNQENYFPASHPIRSASQIINGKFGGSQTISVMVSGDIKDPDVMNRIDGLTSKLESESGVGRVFSISQVIREMSRAIFIPGEAGYDRIPDSRNGIAQLFELYNMSGDQGDFNQLMNTDNSKAHILIRLSDPQNSIVRHVEDLILSETKGMKADITVGGYAIIMTDFAESVIKGQVYSLLFAVITVFLLLAIIFRSFRGGLTGTIPLAGSILILFGFMGATGIALDAATALLSSIMIGVGVDFTIQYMWCFNSELRKNGDYIAATEKSIMTIGRSIIINAFSVMAGFSALMFSGFTSIRFFGYLVLISMGACLVGAILVIPAFLLKFRPRFIEKNLSPRKKEKYEKETDLIPSSAAAFSGSGSTA